MKILLLHAVTFLGFISSIWGQSLPEIRDILRQEEGHVIITKLMKESPEVRQKELLAMIVDLVKAHLAEPATSKNNKIQFYNAVILLIDAGDEQAILDAFKDGIDNVKLGELIDVVDALATCRGEEQTDIIERLARDRLAILGDTLVRSENVDERYARNDLLGSFVRILLKLASSANPSGMARAKKIRDELAVLYPSENGKILLAAIDAELAKVASGKPVTFGPPGASPTSSLPSKKPPAAPKASEVKSAAASAEPTSPIPWLVGGMLIVAAIGLLWLLLKRRS